MAALGVGEPVVPAVVAQKIEWQEEATGGDVVGVVGRIDDGNALSGHGRCRIEGLDAEIVRREGVKVRIWDTGSSEPLFPPRIGRADEWQLQKIGRLSDAAMDFREGGAENWREIEPHEVVADQARPITRTPANGDVGILCFEIDHARAGDEPDGDLRVSELKDAEAPGQPLLRKRGR